MMLVELLNKQRDCTNYFFDSLDLSKAEKILKILIDCKGVLFFTGVGKSGFVAKKIAFTMVSTGTKAFYISPTDALHGDVGMVNKEDAFILISKSGESDELLHMIPAIKKKGAFLIAIVCKPDSRLSKACDFSMTLPLLQELCPFDMAPTTSTASQMLFGDLLTVALMRHKEFGLDEYALNHPSGSLGKRMTLRVENLMIKGEQVPLCHPDNLLAEVLVELSDKRCGCLLVVNKEGYLQGLFTDGDLRRALQKKGSSVLNCRLSEIMTRSPLSINSKVLAWDALKLMESNTQKRITILPVTDSEGYVLGLLHLHDIIQSGL